MRTKHISFREVDRAAFIASQRKWLEVSRASGGLVEAWAAEAKGEARAVFTWRDQGALDDFQENVHDRALADAGADGRAAVLYLDDVAVLGPRSDAGFVGESIAWIKEGGIDAYLESQRVWADAVRAVSGFVGGDVRRGRRTIVSTLFFRDRAAHRDYLHRVVPELRGRTRGDEHVARLVRFEGELVAELCV